LRPAIYASGIGKASIQSFEYKPAVKKGDIQIWTRELAGGSTAIGVFNLGYATKDVTVNLADLGLNGEYTIRDTWTHKDLGDFNGTFCKEVRGHASLLLKATKKMVFLQ
jgi:alpha-galactosidase